MNALDYAIFAVIFISVLFALWRGFIHQAISLAGWIVALIAARLLAPELASIFTLLKQPEYQLMAAYSSIVLVVILASRVVAGLFGGLVQRLGLGLLDRLLGLVFGVLRGLIILVLLVAITSLTSLKEHPLWQTSQLMPYLEKMRDLGAGKLEDFTNQGSK